MVEPDARVAPPPDGPRPPAPPGVDDPGFDPSDPGPPIGVLLDDMPLGDLGNPRVDSRLVVAILLRDGAVARRLRERGVEIADVQRAFADASWPLRPSLGRPGADEPDPAGAAPIDVRLAERRLGELGDAETDARLLRAILTRHGLVGRWLRERGVGDAPA